jgi:hypothetical protein
MGLNLATKYSPQIDKIWVAKSFIAGKCSTKYDLIGTRSLVITSPLTVDLVDYTRSGLARFGTVNEMQDEVQELTMSKDRAWTMSIDKANASDQLDVKKTGEALQMQLDEKVIPEQDKWALRQWAFNAGKSAVIADSTKSTIIGLIADGHAFLDNNLVPNDGRFTYIGATKYNQVRMSDEILAVDPMAVQALGKGVVGMLFDSYLVRVPDSYLPTGVQFMIMHKEAGIAPKKLHTLRILTEVQGIDGAVLEGHHYYDAFVIGKKAVGIYAGVLTANKVAAPIVTPTGASHAFTAVSGVTFKYTLDGSDPRYSKTAVTSAGPVVLTAGQTIKVAGFAADKCVSDVTSATYAG